MLLQHFGAFYQNIPHPCVTYTMNKEPAKDSRKSNNHPLVPVTSCQQDAAVQYTGLSIFKKVLQSPHSSPPCAI
eukprot:11542237-Ditylum_brightwellii.AAC.1